MVRTGVVEYLIAPGRGSAGNLAGHGVDNALYGILVQIGNHAAVFICLEIFEGNLVTVFVDAVAAVKHGAVSLFLRPGGVSIIMVYGLMQHRGCASGEVEAGVGKTGEHRCGIEVARGLFKCVGYNGSLGLACSEDDGYGFGVVGYGVQTDGDYRLDAGDLDASEVARCCCLGLVVGMGQACGGVRVTATDVECDMSVGTDTSEEESDAAHIPDFLVVVSAPVVNHEDRLLLHVLNG